MSYQRGQAVILLSRPEHLPITVMYVHCIPGNYMQLTSRPGGAVVYEAFFDQVRPATAKDLLVLA